MDLPMNGDHYKSKGKGKGKFHPRKGHKGPEGGRVEV